MKHSQAAEPSTVVAVAQLVLADGFSMDLDLVLMPFTYSCGSQRCLSADTCGIDVLSGWSPCCVTTCCA